MPTIYSDAILHYDDGGAFGARGYGVPNWGNDVGSLNINVWEVVDLIGKNVFNIMHHEDVDLTIPPSLNTLMRIHKLYLRVASILKGRAVPPGKLNMETMHVSPAGQIFKVYPVPYFKVRNAHLRRWCELAFIGISEAMQHTENRKSIEISTDFAGQVGQYFKRIYVNMAVELFAKTTEEAEADGFALAEADFVAYDPAKFFTRTEMVDTVTPLDLPFTEDRLRLLREGINVTDLPHLKPWPVNLQSYYQLLRASGEQDGGTVDDSANAAAGSSTKSAAPIIPKAPGP